MLVVAHISDLHFNGTAGGRDRVTSVLDYINRRADGIDALVVTGDIADDGRQSEYEEAAATLITPLPMLVLPGNHDVRGEFGHALLRGTTETGPLNHSQMIAGALFLMCDSSIPGQNEGRLDDDTLTWMDAQIAGAGSHIPVFVAFHHPPVTVQMPFMDTIRQSGEERLIALVDKHPNIVAFLCGHAHTGAVTAFAGRPLCLAPGVSSTLNLPFEGSDVVNETQPPGLAFHVYAEGRIISHFRSVPAV
ncbi:metallophosphoesterase [Williamsia sp. 1135]|uniref:metallophosphoesterase n=1 Tax=Williamsia sp. 1135 TaxID=1889262 RepID=UPI000A115407|nr:metallophosphoesterase [Williamsia sp. 1135]ORM27718.1 metallophosphoesterase [Williamsia sp. 1135]